MSQVRLTGPESIPAVVQAMTLEEKASFVAGKGAFQTQGIERLGIPSFIPLDGHNGMNMAQYLTVAADNVLAREGLPSAGLGVLFGLMTAPGLGDLENLPTRGLSEEALAAMPEAQRPFMRALAEEFRALLPEGGMPTCFPPGILMASTWDPDLVGQCDEMFDGGEHVFGVSAVESDHPRRRRAHVRRADCYP